jgi:putative transposase
VKFQLVETMVSERIPVKLCCKVLEVSRSGFYAWLDRPESERKRANGVLIEQIKSIHKSSRGTYGLPRIKADLKNVGVSCGKARLENLMKKAGISGLIKRRFKVRTTDSNHNNPIAERLFKTEDASTHPVAPNRLWASDISYIATDQGFLYLATYLDLYTRKIVGFSINDHMRTDLLESALDMALGRQGLIEGELLSHSDRGTQYASDQYRSKLAALNIRASMSRKGNCWDNAFAESFFATLKKELVYRERYKTHEEAKKSVFEYIEVWYNRKRIHSSIGYMTPVQYEESLAA